MGILQTLEGAGKKFITVMIKVGKDIKVAWNDVVAYLPAAAGLATVFFPTEFATVNGVVNAMDLIQQAVVTVEQKFAAAGAPTGTGPQKAAQVLSLVSPTVTQLLTSEGIKVDTAFIQNIINGVVAILNVRTVIEGN